jgi:capsular exopolysaccharide synthesis family protein
MNPPKEKVVLVTSTQPGEGKTFVSVNLAISLSMMDRKVLLVGLDLRKPMVSRLLKIESKEGITAYLSGQVDDPRKLICKLNEYPNLDILPAGVIPPNPNELIIKEKFDQLFTDMREEYDFIILDTSPVGAVSDTYLIDRVADICMYVTRSEYSDKRNIEYINRLDREGTLKRIYIVINDVKFESNKYAYYRRYGYGYGYGYSYGHDKK